MEPLILASASPQRKTLLGNLGIPFVVIPSQVNEEACTEKHPAARAELLAREKAQEVADRHRGRWVLGSDTLVVAPDGSLLEKPADADEARRMIRLQSGGTSVVHSGMALISPSGVMVHGLSSSDVTFRALNDKDVEWWIGTGLWENRSGSFQIDGPGQLMIREIRGDWSSIVGLPVFLFGQLAKEVGFKI